MIHLEEPRFKVSIKQYVETKNLKAKLIFHVIRLSGPINLPQVGLSCYKCFYNQIVYSSFESFYIKASILENPIYLAERSLMTAAVSLGVLILFKVIRKLVYGIIGQMHEHTI